MDTDRALNTYMFVISSLNFKDTNKTQKLQFWARRYFSKPDKSHTKDAVL